jgi:tetratricopeptide (TPR) repeat protein
MKYNYQLSIINLQSCVIASKMKCSEAIFLSAGKIFYLLSFVLCLLSQNSFAQPPQEIFNTANTLYQNGEFEKAAAQYEKIISQGYESADAYYNLGNCYFKQNETGKAILNYERAKKLAPDNEDIDFNLRLANLRVADRIEPLPQMMLSKWFNAILTTLTSDTWSKWAVALLWLSFASFAAFLFINISRLKFISFLAGVFTLFFSVAFFLIAFYQNNYEETHRHGIVIVTNTYIKSAPATNATDLFILREGVKAELLENSEEWQKIKLADGKIGWIQKAHLEVI